MRAPRSPRCTHTKPCSGAGLAEPIDKLVGMAAYGFVEYLQRVLVVRVPQHIAFAIEDEAGRFDLLLHDSRIDAMQGVGILQAGTIRCDVIDDHKQATGLERSKDLLVELRQIDLTHECIGIVVVVLRGEYQVNRLWATELCGRLVEHTDVLVMRIGQKRSRGTYTLRIFLGVLVRPNQEDMSLRTDSRAEYTGEITLARNQFQYFLTRFDFGKCHDVGNLATRIVGLVGLTRWVVDRIGDR